MEQRLRAIPSEIYSEITDFKSVPLVAPSTPTKMTLTLTLIIQDSGPFSHRTMFRFSKLKLIGLGGLGMVPIRSLFYCDKTEIGLCGLGMVPIRSLLWQKLKLASVVLGMVPNRSSLSQFRLGILGRTLKVVLPSACPVFSWRSLPMVLLTHCPGGCSRGSPLRLRSSCPARWDGALLSEVSGS